MVSSSAGAPRESDVLPLTQYEGEKWALVEGDPEVFFTTPHFDGYPAVLVNLRAIRMQALREVVTDAWLSRAPKRLVKEYLASGRAPG